MKKNISHLIRLSIVSVFLVLILAAIIWRIFDLMVLNRKFLKNQGDARSIRTVEIPAYRGMITDRNGVPLAISTQVESVWVNPKLFKPSKEQLKALSHVLHVPSKFFATITKKHQHKEFIYLSRQLSPAIAGKVRSLNIAGINFQQEYKRYYPQLESSAHVVGFTNIDDKGIEGMELAYHDWLRGENGKRRVIKDRIGRVVEELQIVKSPRPGRDVALSIDSRIQYFAYNALVNTCKKFEAKSGSVVVLDAKTGEIIAIVNYPSFNPNARTKYVVGDFRNRAIVDAFEPGSVIKPFSIASVLEAGHFTPDTIIDTRPGWMVVDRRLIRDVHNYGVVSVTGVLENSSNVGVSQMILTEPPNNLLSLLKKSNFGMHTESDYPGESEGSLIDIRQMSPFVHATLGFGYGMTATALQLAKAYLIFANDGNIIPVSMLAWNAPLNKEQVISKKTANEMLTMLESVSLYGTGRSAQVPGYRVAGKTGTARIAGENGYEDKRYIATFVGIAPVSRPKLIVVVVINEPSKQGYYGATVAGPLFTDVMSASLHILNVLPDKALHT